jgi:hypothetical protein
MRRIKHHFLIFTIFFVAICSCKNMYKSESIMMAGSEISLTNPWVEFDEVDNSNIGNLIRGYKFDEGKQLFKKRISESEIIIACLKTDNSWDFYYTNLKTREMMALDEEIKQEIDPPKLSKPSHNTR